MLVTADIQSLDQQNCKVDQHEGSPKDWLARHRMMCWVGNNAGPEGLNVVAGRLVRRSTDDRSLALAFNEVRRRGGGAGPDGQTTRSICDLVGVEPTETPWPWIRGLRDSLRLNPYVPGPTIERRIPKRSKPGTRTIHVADVEDRVVQRSIFQVAEPVVALHRDPRSLGWWRELGTRVALARLQRLIESGHTSLVTADLTSAFDHVPLGRVQGLLPQYWPNDEFLELIGRVVDSGQQVGLRQGSGLSPLLTNIYLHDAFDALWDAHMPGVPFLRYGDDILLAARSPAEAKKATAVLRKLFTEAEMPITIDGEPSVYRLHRGAVITWLGFDISYRYGVVRFKIPERAIQQLPYRFKAVKGEDEQDQRRVAEQKLLGWIGSYGPAWAHEDHRNIYKRLVSIWRGVELGRSPRRPTIVNRWADAHEKYQELYEATPQSATRSDP